MAEEFQNMYNMDPKGAKETKKAVEGAEKAIKSFSRNGKFFDNDLPKPIEFFDDAGNFSAYPKKLRKKETNIWQIGSLIAKYRRRGFTIFRFLNFIHSYKKGKSYAFIGPDGSGKGFFINKLIF